MSTLPVTLSSPSIFAEAAVINTSSGSNGANVQTTTVWPSANEAIFLPFMVEDPITVKKICVFNGNAVSGNIDAGIYDASGVLLVSIGSTTQVNTNTVQIFDIADTVLSTQGIYYAAVVLDNGVGTIHLWPCNSQICRANGIYVMATAFPLPANATFAVTTRNVVPLITWTQTTLI